MARLSRIKYWDLIADYVLTDSRSETPVQLAPLASAKFVKQEGFIGKLMRVLGAMTPLPIWWGLAALLLAVFPYLVLTIWDYLVQIIPESFWRNLPDGLAVFLVGLLTIISGKRHGVLAAIITAAASSTIVFSVVYTATQLDFSLPPPSEWGAGLVVAYMAFVLWVLRRV